MVPTMSAAPSPTSFPPDPDRVEALFERFEALNPHPQTELAFKDPYTLVVAVALSAQATDKAVNKATEKLFAIADTPQKMLDLGVEGVMPLISSIGLYRNKAKNVVALSQILVERWGGKAPLEREALQALPGVGRKTASVVLNELGVEAAIAVDTHVYRVSHRLGLADATSPEKVERQLFQVVPEKYLGRAHHWLILHGRYICTSQRPKCQVCPVSDLCPWFQQNSGVAASAARRTAATKRSAAKRS